jgi:hypothetical protein
MPNMKKSDPMLAKQVKKDVKFLKEKAVAKKSSDPSKTKPFNVQLMTPRELVGGKEPRNEKRVPASASKKATEKMKSMPKVKITGSASSKPQVSGSMIKSQPKTATKPKAPAISKSTKTSTPKTTTKAPAKSKMTPQDAAMKKILEKKYGKIYG